MAYTNDLVRLATSARFSISAGTLVLTPRAACNAILEGYRTSIRARWQAVRPCRGTPGAPPRRRTRSCEIRFASGRRWPISRRLAARWPRRSHCCAASSDAREDPRYVTRRAGLGSLGHPRIVAIAEHSGRLDRARGKGAGRAPGWRGRWAARQACRSTTRRSSAGRCDAPIPSSRSAVAGCSAGLRPTAAGSSSRSRGSRPSRPSCSTPWAPRRPTSTSGRERGRIAAVSRDLDRAIAGPGSRSPRGPWSG